MARSKRSFFDIRFVLLFAIICGGIVYLILYGMVFDLEGIIISLICSTIYTSVMWGAQGLTLLLVSRYLPLRSKRDVLVRVAIHGASIVLSFLLATAFIQLVFNPGFLDSRGTLMIIAMVAFTASIVGNGLDYMEILHQRLRRAESAALAAELAALRAQIDPHFLFNSLNSIAALVRLDPERAETLIESLADLFRYTLRTSEQPTVALGEDLAATELYLAIERARFGERLAIAIDIPDSLARAHVPSMTLQPLAENAIKHGAAVTQGRCEVTIRAAADGDDVVLTVRDSGPGFDTADLETLVARGKGLGNVRDRLRHAFGERGRMVIAERGVEIRFPRTAPVVARSAEEGRGWA